MYAVGSTRLQTGKCIGIGGYVNCIAPFRVSRFLVLQVPFVLTAIDGPLDRSSSCCLGRNSRSARPFTLRSESRSRSNGRALIRNATNSAHANIVRRTGSQTAEVVRMSCDVLTAVGDSPVGVVGRVLYFPSSSRTVLCPVDGCTIVNDVGNRYTRRLRTRRSEGNSDIINIGIIVIRTTCILDS